MRIAILGAGPIGLEAGIASLQNNCEVTIFERGEIAQHIDLWGHVRMFTPFGWNHTQAGKELILRENPKHEFPSDSDYITGQEYRESYLLPLAMLTPLSKHIQLETEVIHIGKMGIWKSDDHLAEKRKQNPFRLLIRDNKGAEKIVLADLVLDCSGTYRYHRWCGEGGIPALNERSAERWIAYGLEDILGKQKNNYANKSVLVIGDGYSAATTICSLANLAEDYPATWTIWLSRRSKSTPLPRLSSDPLKERDKLAARANHLATRGEGNLEYHGQSIIESIETAGADKGFSIQVQCAGKPVHYFVDRLIANVGYQPNRQLFQELAIDLPDSDLPTLIQKEPNFFVLGAKSGGRNSRFLLKQGYDQIREIFNLIQKKKGLYPLR